jgi:hypothetical protein
MRRKEIMIEKQKLILAEGEDAVYFFINLLVELHIEEIQVFDYGGIKDLTQFLKNLSKLDGYDDVISLLIARDSEDSSISAIQSVNTSLKALNLIEEDIQPFIIQKKAMSIGCVLFPGYDENHQLCPCGTLEDLCLKLFQESAVAQKTDEYLADYQNKQGASFKRLHKNKLHGTFSFTDKYVGLKLGEALKVGAYDIQSSYLKPFRDIINAL